MPMFSGMGDGAIVWRAAGDDPEPAPARPEHPEPEPAPISWRAEGLRVGLEPAHQEPAVAGFWWAHPLVVRFATTIALLWGAGYLVWRAGWSGAGVPAWLF